MQKTTEKKDFFKGLINNTIIFAFGTIGSKAILFILIPLYTNVLSKEEFGKAEFIITIGQLLAPIIAFGTYDGFFRFALRKEHDINDLIANNFIVISIGITFLIAISPILCFYTPIKGYVIYVLLLVISQVLYFEVFNLLKVLDYNKTYSILSIIQALLLVCLNLVLLCRYKFGVKGYLLSTIISTFTVTVFAGLRCLGALNIRKGRINAEIIKSLVLFSIPLSINSISWWGIHSSNKIIIESVIGLSALGLYSAASKLPSLLNILIIIFQQAWRLSSIKSFDEDDFNKKNQIILEKYVCLIIALSIVLSCFIKDIMKYYVGKEFFEAWRIVPLLIVSTIFSALSSYCGPLLEAKKDSKTIMNTTLLGCAINIISNYLLIKQIGVLGIPVATLISYVAISFARMRQLNKTKKLFKIDQVMMLCLIPLVQSIIITFDIHIYLTSAIAMSVFASVVIISKLYAGKYNECYKDQISG